MKFSRRDTLKLLAGTMLAGCGGTDPDKHYKFATWNIAGGAPLYRNRGRLPRIAQWLKDEQIDFCAFQETDRFARTSNFIDFPAYLEETIGGHSYFIPAAVNPPHEPGAPPREYGNCIWSRFPFKRAFAATISEGPFRPYGENPEWGHDRRLALFAQVELEGRPLWLGSTHFSSSTGDGQFSPAIRHTQARNLLYHFNVAAGDDMPLVLGGDFNAAAYSAALSPLRSELDLLTVPVGRTWPLYPDKSEQTPLSDIDHIFARSVAGDNPRKQLLHDLSDHAAVIVDFRLKGSGGPGRT